MKVAKPSIYCIDFIVVLHRFSKLGLLLAAALFGISGSQICFAQSDDSAELLARLEESLKADRARLGEDHIYALASMSSVASSYSDLGQHEKARALREQTLKLRRAKLGEDHPHTLDSMNDLAKSYRALGQYDKAIDIGEQTLKLRRAKLGEDHPLTLGSMNNLAASYNALGQYEKARSLKEQILKLSLAELDERFRKMSPGKYYVFINTNLGEDEQALMRRYQTLKINRATLGEDHPDTLGSMNNLAVSYRVLGHYEKALDLGEQTLKLMRAKLGEDHPHTLSSMHNLAVIYKDLSQNDKALDLGEQTLKLRRAKLGEDHPDTLASMQNLADSYRVLGQHDKAIDLGEQNLKLRRAKQGEDHPDTLTARSNLANSYSDHGQYDKALDLREQNLKFTRAKLGEDYPDTLNSMNNLANSYSDLGQHEKARALREQTLKLRRAKLGEDHPDTLASMHNLANSYSDLGQHDKALDLREQTLKLRRARLGEHHPDTLASMSNLTISYSALGQYDKALDLREQTLKLMRAKLGEDHPDTLASMHNLAASYSDLGQYDKALDLGEQTLKLRRARLGVDHPDTLVSMNNLVISYGNLGQHAMALLLISGIVDGVEKLRNQPGLGISERRDVFAVWSDRYQSYAAFLAAAAQLATAFNLGDISKARTLTESILGQNAERSLPVADQQALRASEEGAQQLKARLELLATQKMRESPASALLATQKDIERHKAAHAELVADIKLRHPKYAQLTALTLAGAERASALLAKGEAFVSYLLQTNGNAQAHVLDASGKVQWINLGKIANHASTVEATRDLLTEAAGTGQLVRLKDGGYQWLPHGEALPAGTDPAQPQTLAKDTSRSVGTAPSSSSHGPVTRRDEALRILQHYWHDTLVKPVLAAAGRFPRWIISPDKDLALLPFDILVESFGKAGKPDKMLVDSRSLTLVQSFAVFALLKQRTAEYATLKRPKQMLAMGNAVYGEGWSENRGIRRGGTVRGFNEKDGLAGGRGYALGALSTQDEQHAMQQFSWQNLPGTAAEVRTITMLFAGGADAYTGPDASEARLLDLSRSGRLRDYQYLLFSAHGYLARNSELSSLVLSQKGNPTGIDGYVTAAEWPLYDVKSDLTVLSACDTGVGKTQAGESVMGLPYALFVAGNKNTLLSLWPVDDDATAEFMKRFFSRLKAGKEQPDALRLTKQEFIKHPKWNAPRFWAAFTLYGI